MIHLFPSSVTAGCHTRTPPWTLCLQPSLQSSAVISRMPLRPLCREVMIFPYETPALLRRGFVQEIGRTEPSFPNGRSRQATWHTGAFLSVPIADFSLCQRHSFLFMYQTSPLRWDNAQQARAASGDYNHTFIFKFSPSAQLHYFWLCCTCIIVNELICF